MTAYSVVGKPVTRQEGPDKVSGHFQYAADVALPGMIWGKVLRSPYPHAKIIHIDASRAMGLPGVRAVITGQDTAGMRVGRMVRDVPLLAEDKVRFVGEKVAAVAANDLDTAEEALALIEVEYEPLPAVFDPLEAMEPGAPLVHEGSPEFESSAGMVQPQGNILDHATWSNGELEQGFGESDLIFEHTFTTTWVHQGYMEPYACVVDIDDTGRIQVWANNKVPFTLRRQLADALAIPQDRILVNPCGIGGDFGGKSPAMNVPLAYLLSQRSGRPVKMVMSYIEELIAGNPRHPSVVTIKTGVKRDGKFWARHSKVVYNGVGASSALIRDLFCSSQGSNIDHTYAQTEGFVFVIANGGQGPLELYDFTGHQCGWELLDQGYDHPYIKLPGLMDFSLDLARMTVETADAPSLEKKTCDSPTGAI